MNLKCKHFKDKSGTCIHMHEGNCFTQFISLGNFTVSRFTSLLHICAWMERVLLPLPVKKKRAHSPSTELTCLKMAFPHSENNQCCSLKNLPLHQFVHNTYRRLVAGQRGLPLSLQTSQIQAKKLFLSLGRVSTVLQAYYLLTVYTFPCLTPTLFNRIGPR